MPRAIIALASALLCGTAQAQPVDMDYVTETLGHIQKHGICDDVLSANHRIGLRMLGDENAAPTMRDELVYGAWILMLEGRSMARGTGPDFTPLQFCMDNPASPISAALSQ